MIKSFKVTIDTVDHVKDELLIAHIKDAVGHWGGSFEPSDPLFPTNIKQVSVAKIVKTRPI